MNKYRAGSFRHPNFTPGTPAERSTTMVQMDAAYGRNAARADPSGRRLAVRTISVVPTVIVKTYRAGTGMALNYHNYHFAQHRRSPWAS